MHAQQQLQTTLDVLESKASVSVKGLKRAMVACAKEVIVVADASKFGRVAFATVAGLDAVKRVITDSSLRRDTISRLDSMGIEVSVV